METFVQQILNGLVLGSMYALVALGYTMVYGVLNLINFAHGDVLMIGAMVGLSILQLLDAHFPGLPGYLQLAIAILGAIPVAMLVNVLIERIAYRRLRNAPRLAPLITAIGVSLLLQYSGQVFFGAAPRTFPPVLPSRNFEIGTLTLSSNQLVVIGVAIALVVALQFIVFRTKMGTAMRAVSLNPKAAQLVGVNNNVVITFTFALGSALAGAGGILYSLNYPSIDPLMGVMPGLKAFVAAILGGIGNIPGAALGGLLLGTVETFVAGSQYSTYKDAIAFAILIIILLFRPAGLLGRFTAEKV
jgi:branched-chain amino acid transport system permease protein